MVSTQSTWGLVEIMIYFLVILCALLTISQGNSISKAMDQEEEGGSDYDFDFAPFYRFAGKRGYEGAGCAVHRYTLMELHHMMKEEVADFESCVAKLTQ